MYRFKTGFALTAVTKHLWFGTVGSVVKLPKAAISVSSIHTDSPQAGINLLEASASLIQFSIMLPQNTSGLPQNVESADLNQL